MRWEKSARLRRGMEYGELQVRLGHLTCILWHPVAPFVVRRRVCVSNEGSCLRQSGGVGASCRCESSVVIVYNYVYGAHFP